MKKLIFIFMIYGIIIPILQTLPLSLIAAQDCEWEKQRCEMLGECDNICKTIAPVPLPPPSKANEVVTIAKPVSDSTEIEKPCESRGDCPETGKKVVDKITSPNEKHSQLPMTNKETKPECSIEVNIRQMKCDKNYEDLKKLWHSFEQDFKNTSNGMRHLHNLVNKDEVVTDFDGCSGCYLIEIEDASKHPAIVNINPLLQGLKIFYVCVLKMNAELLTDFYVPESMLEHINKMIEASYDSIVKMCFFRDSQLPEYEKYINALSRSCKAQGRFPHVVDCKTPTQ